MEYGKRHLDVPDAYTPVDGPMSYTFDPSTGFASYFEQIISGLNGAQNLLTLSECVPEIFAPIHEIASRVADAVWELKRFSTDNPIYSDNKFNDLFSSPNPTQSMKELIYESIFYELLIGRQYFYINSPRITEKLGAFYQNIAAWFNLPAQDVSVRYKKDFNLYTATTMDDIVDKYELNGIKYDADRVLPVQGLNLRNKQNPLDGKPALRSAHKAISNLIAVYEARGVIYIKRGMLGLIVSKKTDASGTIALTPTEKKNVRDEFNRDYGLTKNRDLVGISNVSLDYLNMAMSIKDLEPFRETLADAVAIYAVLGVPRHLVPSEGNSTFANADADLKKFYTSIVIPMAKKYAEKFTKFFRFDLDGKYVDVSYEHVELLQADKKLAADVLSTTVGTYMKLWDANMITQNEFLIGIGREKIEGGDVYKKDIEPEGEIDPITGQPKIV